MKIKLIITVLFFINILSAQKIYFPKTAASDSAILEKSISNIASGIVGKYERAKKLDSIEKLFKLEILAGRFKKSITTIEKYRIAFANPKSACTKFINYEIYASAKDIEKNEKMTFPKAVEKAFNIKYATLPEKYSFRIAEVFNEDMPFQKNKLKKSLASLKTDSLTNALGIGLAVSYLDYKVSSGIQSKVTELLLLKDKERYNVESFDLKTRTGGNVTLIITRRKGSEQSLPVILTNNIYAGKYDYALGKRAVAYNYIGVVVNTRGKRDSKDDIEPFEHESQDLYDVIDWISKQPWCNGKVGMIGGSYLGFSQWGAVKKLHPALKTIVPQVSVGIGIDYPMTNNVFMSYMLQWISYVTNNNLTDESDFKNFTKWDSINKSWYKSGKSFRTLNSVKGQKDKIFQRWLDHPSYDEFWKNMVPYKNDFSKINIPVLTTTGFYDDDQLGAMYYFKEYYKYNKDSNHYLVMGPYDHGGAQSYGINELRGYNLDAVARINISDLAFSWFDYILKDGVKPELLKDKINVQIMDTNEWLHVPVLEKTHNSKLKFYLAKKKDEKLSLTKEKPTKGDFVKQTIDFKMRDDKDVYFKVSKQDSLNINNSLVYETEILDRDIIISGAFNAQLKAAINKKDMDITISLFQVKPDNKIFFLSDFLGRASYAEDREKRKLLNPGKVETIPVINSMFVSKKIPKGSRLIILLGINKTSAYQINYGSGKDVSDETIDDAKEPLEVKWYTDSYVEIPTIEK
ncbi:CocE/NonD family hydrolase [Chryseobacterium paludis]|uniref:CocE/NonD family hydrolase n=1 Tax=Chryseobacterium paludis TaxID=2956784 RepID=UPI0021C1FF1B|nr:CocE/NonD family hydrolase [Chryseobacterium paludis]